MADRGALTNDDRLDALAMACQYWVDAMAQDAEVRMGARKEELMVAELDRLKAAVPMRLAVIQVTKGRRTTVLGGDLWVFTGRLFAKPAE